MNSLKLSEEQKGKLLKICGVLFPEYTFEFTKSNTTDSLKKIFSYNTEEYLAIHEPKEPYDCIIHWFELCLTHLSDKIGGVESDYLKSQIFELDGHPVDYIYQEFLKLKNE